MTTKSTGSFFNFKLHFLHRRLQSSRDRNQTHRAIVPELFTKMKFKLAANEKKGIAAPKRARQLYTRHPPAQDSRANRQAPGPASVFVSACRNHLSKE
jgi:hypothetical protein